MKYLIKDLAQLTGLTPSRIRKWQERYNLFTPSQAENGYFYYSNDDLFKLKKLSHLITNGYNIGNAIENITKVNEIIVDDLGTESHNTIKLILENDFQQLEKELNQKLDKIGLSEHIKTNLPKLIELVGTGWERQLLTVADEHAFSRWFSGYLLALLPDSENKKPIWLVSSYYKDEHELGALLHYSRLRLKNIPAKFCGNLPREELFMELAQNSYKTLSVSFVMPRRESEINIFKQSLKSRFNNLNILFGGKGYRGRVKYAG